MATDVLQQVTELRALEDQVKARRATAEANLTLAKQRLESTEAEIRAQGFEPDQAEQAVRALEAELEAAVVELRTQLQTEDAECKKIIEITAEALK